MDTKTIVIDGKEFTVQYDIKNMLESLNYYIDDDNEFCHSGDQEKPSTKEEVEEEIVHARTLITNIEKDGSFLIPLINRMGKKKNGYLKKGSVAHIWYEEVSYVSEDEYGYRVLCIKAKAIDEKNINLFVDMDIQHW